MTGSDCEKYRVPNVQCLMVASIGKILQLNRTNSPKCLRNGSFSHPYLQGGERSACLGEGCTWGAWLFRAVSDYCTNLSPNVRAVLLGVVPPENPLLGFISFKPPASRSLMMIMQVSNMHFRRKFISNCLLWRGT